MTLEIDVHIGGVDGQTNHEFKTNDPDEALKFINRFDHEGSTTDVRVIAREGDVYLLLQELKVLRQIPS